MLIEKREEVKHDLELKKIKSAKKLRELLTDFVSLSKDVLTEFNDEVNPEFHRIVYQNLLQRLYIGICAVDTLMGPFERNKYYKYPIAIQMRTCILDSITIAYLSLFIDKQNPNKFNEQITRLNHPMARELNEEIEEMIRKGNTEYKEHFKLASFHFPDNFTNGEKIKLKKLTEIKPKQMAVELEGTALEWYADIYGVYRHYSKYEHYGTMSKTLLEFDAEYEFDKLTFSTCCIFHAAYMAMQFMEVDRSKIEEMRLIGDRIVEVEPTFKKNAASVNKG